MCLPVTSTYLVSSVLRNNNESVDFHLLRSGLAPCMVPVGGLEKCAHPLPRVG